MLKLCILSTYLENIGTRFEWRNASAPFHMYVFGAGARFAKRHTRQSWNHYYLLHNLKPNL
jgi:hypothetical protein